MKNKNIIIIVLILLLNCLLSSSILAFVTVQTKAHRTPPSVYFIKNDQQRPTATIDLEKQAKQAKILGILGLVSLVLAVFGTQSIIGILTFVCCVGFSILALFKAKKVIKDNTATAKQVKKAKQGRNITFIALGLLIILLILSIFSH